MELLKIAGCNVFSYNKFSLDVRNLTFVLIKGKTGHGKSAIFDTMSSALFGVTARKKYKSILRDIPEKQRTGYSKVWFKQYGNVYKVKRVYGKGKRLYLFENKKLLKYRTQTMVQDAIIKILGFDTNTFANIAYFDQNDIGKFLSRDSTERIKIIGKIGNVAIFDKVRNDIKNDIDETKIKSNRLSGNYETYKEIIKDIDVKEISRIKRENEIALTHYGKKIVIISQNMENTRIKYELVHNLKKIENEYADKKSNYDDEVKEINDELNLLRNKNTDTTNLKIRLNKIKDQANDYNKHNSEIKIINKELIIVNSRISSLKTKLKIIDGDINKNEKFILEFKENNICPTCNSKITKEHLQHFSSHITDLSDRRKDLIVKIDKLNGKIERLNNKDESARIEIKKLSSSNQTKEKILNRIFEIENLSKQIDKLKNKKKKLNDKYKTVFNELKNEIKKNKKDLNYYKEYDVKELSDLENQYVKIDRIMNKLMSNQDLIKYKLNKYAKYHKKLKKIKEQLKLIDDKYDMYKWCYDAVPKIKMQAIMSMIPILQMETNKNLSQLIDGKVLKFDCDPNKKTNRLNVFVYDYVHNKKRIYEGWSGGEKGIMDVCTDLALNKLSNSISGNQINFIILDEKFANLDDELRGKVFDVLKTEYNDRKIFCISHVQNIESEFNQVIDVKKVNNISNLNIRYN